jgi:phage-related protein
MNISYNLIKYFLICLFVLVLVGGLSLKKIKLFCIGCSKGSWWYKCVEGTGYGSVQCDLYKSTYNTIGDLINSVVIVKEQIAEIINKFVTVLTTIENVITNAGNEIKNQLYLPDIEIPKIEKPNISCNVDLIGDLCSPIKQVVHTVIDQLNTTTSFITDLLNKVTDLFSLVIDFLIVIVDKFSELFSLLFKDITKPITTVYKLILELKNEIISLYDSFLELGIFNIIIYNIINILEIILPIRLISTVSTALLVIIIILLLPIIGVIYVVLKLLYNLLILPFTLIKSFIIYIYSLIFI